MVDADDLRFRAALVGPTHPAPGGIVHFTHGLERALTARDACAIVIGWRRRFPERLSPGAVRDEVSQTPITAPGEPILDMLNPMTWRTAARAIRTSGATTAVLQWWHPLHAPVVRHICRSARRAGIRTVLICHNVEPHETNAGWRGLTRLGLRAPDAVLVHADTLAEEAARLAPHARITRAFHPVSENVTSEMRAASAAEVTGLRARLGAGGRKLLLTFGYVRPYKGVEDVIAAMALVESDTVLLVAGECWGDPEAYRDAAERAGVADRVVFDFRYVPNEEMPAIFAAADAVVLPYRTATQSGVAALAFAFDRPVVATRTGGLPELVEEGVTGTLAAPADPADLAQAIDRVVRHEGSWSEGIAAVRARLSWDGYVDLLEHAAAAPAATRDPVTHAVLDRPSRLAKGAKVIAILQRETRLEGARILDIGTGNGTIATLLAEAAGPDGAVTSVDVEDVRVDRDGYAFRRVDGIPLPFTDGSFDVVVSNHVIEHVGSAENQQRHVGEIARVLAPGGVAYVAAPHRWRLIENHYRLPLLSWLPAGLADRYVRMTRRGDRYDCRLVTAGQVRRMMTRAGLTARDATRDLIDATASLDSGMAARALRLGPVRALVRGPAIPTVVAIGRRPG